MPPRKKTDFLGSPWPYREQLFGRAVESVVLRRAYGFALNGDRASDEVARFHVHGWRHRAEKRPVVGKTIRSDRVVRKDFEADDRLVLSGSLEVLVPRRMTQARQQPNGN